MKRWRKPLRRAGFTYGFLPGAVPCALARVSFVTSAAGYAVLPDRAAGVAISIALRTIHLSSLPDHFRKIAPDILSETDHFSGSSERIPAASNRFAEFPVSIVAFSMSIVSASNRIVTVSVSIVIVSNRIVTVSVSIVGASNRIVAVSGSIVSVSNRIVAFSRSIVTASNRFAEFPNRFAEKSTAHTLRNNNYLCVFLRRRDPAAGVFSAPDKMAGVAM